MSKILAQMLKISLLPAATLIVAKVVGLYLAVVLFNLNVFLENEVRRFFSVQLYVDSASGALLANSLSNLLVIAVFALINFVLLFKYTLYKKSTSDPRTIVKLTKLNLLKWVSAKDSVFLKVFTWTIFLLASCALTITSALNGETYMSIGVLAFVLGIIFMWGLIRTFESETAKIYPTGREDYY